MKNHVLVVVILLTALSCTSSQPNFERMSEDELASYNSSVGVQDQVYCTDDIRTGSYLRKRTCAKYSDVVGGRVNSLKVPSSSSSVTYGVQ